MLAAMLVAGILMVDGAWTAPRGAATGAIEQPTFGRPKPGKKKDPKPQAPGAEEPESDIDEPARPDLPDPSSPMQEPRPGSNEFVPSPEEWLESDPPRSRPSADLSPGETYAWRSADGLRFSYTVPANYKSGEGYDLVVICHPDGHDFRWGMQNHLSLKAAESRGSRRLAFRPENIVVSVDGISASKQRPGSRWFACDEAAAVRFRDFVLEMTRILPARRIYLYGCGGSAGGDDGEEDGAQGGGRFVVQFAQSFPALADGVIAYGAGQSPGRPRRFTVPVVYVHGVKNSVVPFSSALAALEANRREGNRLVRLRALRAFNDYPNPVRVSECIDWLRGARTDDPAEALAAVEAMLTPKGGDEYDYICPVWYAGARELLGRILGEPGPLTGEAPFEGKSAPSDRVRDRAREIVGLLDDEARRHIAALEPWLAPPRTVRDLVLDGAPWLGHLIAARDDLRGIAPMESFAERIGFDAAAEEHASAASELIAEWRTRDDAENYAMVGSTLPAAFLYEGYPVDLTSRMKQWQRKHQSGELELGAEALEAGENALNWDAGYRRGLDGYQTIWRKWRFEPKPPAAEGRDGQTPDGKPRSAP